MQKSGFDWIDQAPLCREAPMATNGNKANGKKKRKRVIIFGGLGVLLDGVASAVVADCAFIGNASSGGGGVITVSSAGSAEIRRNAVCGNADPWGVAGISLIGGGTVANNRVWNNLGLGAAVATDGGDAASIAHNSFVDNGATDLYLDPQIGRAHV